MTSDAFTLKDLSSPDRECAMLQDALRNQLVERNVKAYRQLNRLAAAVIAVWPRITRRRAELIDLGKDSHLTAAQADELQNLQRLTDALIDVLQPFALEEAGDIMEELKRRDLW